MRDVNNSPFNFFYFHAPSCLQESNIYYLIAGGILFIGFFYNVQTTTQILAENIPISDIPRTPYVIQSTETEVIPIVPAFVDFDPDTLNLKSRGKYVTVYIELPVNYDINEIDLESIELNNQISIELKPTGIGDYDSNDIPDLMVKFNRSAVQDILEVGDKVGVRITGKLIDEKPFGGSDVIRMISQEK